MKNKETTTPDGKKITITEHEDGRRDVKVEVNSLDVDMSDPRNAHAKEVIERDILPNVSEQKITCTLIHKPTNDYFSFVTSRKNVRANMEVAVKQHHDMKWAGVDTSREVDKTEYCLVENDGNGKIIVTSL